MGFQSIFLFLGRGFIFLFLFAVFLLVLIETIQRGDVDKTVPDNHKETSEVLSYVSQNLRALPLYDVQIVPKTATTNLNTVNPLFEWRTVESWCQCLDATGKSVKAHAKHCIDTEVEDTTLRCSDKNKETRKLSTYQGSYIQTTKVLGYSYPSAKEKCAQSSFKYQATAGLCTKEAELSLTKLSYAVPNPNLAVVGQWESSGKFALGDTTFSLWKTSKVDGSPIIDLRTSLEGMPCLNSARNPGTQEFNIIDFPQKGCGHWKTDEDLFEAIDNVSEWAYLDSNDHAFFSGLAGYNTLVGESKVYLVAEKKLKLKENAFCLGLANQNVVTSYVQDIPLLLEYREILNTVGFVVVAISVLIFIIYLIATRCISEAKRVRKEEIGIYVFWFEHILGIIYAVLSIIIGWITYTLIQKLDTENENLYNVANGNCFLNSKKVNSVFNYLADGVQELYGYVDDFNNAGVIISFIFLFLEVIILIWWAFGFKCSEYLGEKEEEKNLTR